MIHLRIVNPQEQVQPVSSWHKSKTLKCKLHLINIGVADKLKNAEFHCPNNSACVWQHTGESQRENTSLFFDTGGLYLARVFFFFFAYQTSPAPVSIPAVATLPKNTKTSCSLSLLFPWEQARRGCARSDTHLHKQYASPLSSMLHQAAGVCRWGVEEAREGGRQGGDGGERSSASFCEKRGLSQNPAISVSD